jgi:protein SCO1/2
MITAMGYFLYAKQQMLDERLTVIKPAQNFQLVNLQDQTIQLNDYQGKVKLIYFFFSSCPDVCLPSNFFLSKVQNELKEKGIFGDKSVMMSITVDPTRDTSEVLKKYASRFQADQKGWMFLRGEESQIKQTAEQLGVMVVKQKDGNFVHSNVILLVDQDGNLRNYYNASDENLTASYIVKDVMTILK